MIEHQTPEISGVVERMTNWQRNQWMRAGQPGAVDGSVERVEEFLAGLPRRFEHHVFTLTGTGKVPMVDILRGRTGIVIAEFAEDHAVVEATSRMIDRLVRRFRYCLSAEIHQPSGE